MRNIVTIKSFPNGISVHLAEDVSFEEILQQIAIKFKESEKFFKNARFALSFEGRTLSDLEERQIVGMINKVCDIQIACIVGKDQETEQTYLKAIRQLEYEKAEQTAQFYTGSIKDGQILETEQSIIVLGDVNPGCSIVSKKNIVILGGLYGEAFAGLDGREHFIIALQFSPEKVRIADCFAKLTEKPKWSIKQKQVPKIAYINNKQVSIEDVRFDSDLLSQLLF